jgi:glutathione S-transferase
MTIVIPVLVGAPFSTFTRTMRIAFHNLNVEYMLEQTMPLTEIAYKYNPFGRIPSLLHGDKIIFECSAIRNYIDTR